MSAVGTNSSPLAGKVSGHKLTARMVKSRLDSELVGNVSIRVVDIGRPDAWEGQGRGELALVVALGALAAALWPMFQTEDEDVEVAVVYTDEEVGAAKANTCRAFEMARMAIAVRSGANPGENPDPALAEVVAANARSAFAATGPYLLNNIGVATPDALAEAVTNFADQADEVGLAALAGLGTDDPALAGPLGQVTELEAKISEMCK